MNNIDIKTVAVGLLAGILLAGCGASGETTATTEPVDTTTATADGSITFEQNGGCQMMGPNCPTWELRPDGSFTLTRTGSGEVETTGTIDPALAGDLFAAVAGTDFDTLVAGLGPGECQACVDGIDTVVRIDAGATEVALDSAKVGFDPSIRLFELFDRALGAMSAEAQLDIVSR